MLSAERNLFMTRVGRGQPMGELFRQFWLPLTLSQQLPERDGDPVRLRLPGEDLVAFRDTNGNIGAVSAVCPHRRAPLFFGRNQQCGLRCAIDGIPGVREEGVEDRAPQLQVIENEIGFAYGGRRKRRVDDQYYWRVTQFLLPMYTLIPGPGWPRACVGVVPIDDDHAIRFQVSYNPEAPIEGERMFTAREMGEFHFPDGKTIDFWLPTEHRRNRDGLDPE